MKYNKDYTFEIGFGRVGARAGEDCNVWKMGVHIISNDKYWIFRICYLRTQKRTYYWQMAFHKKELEVICP